MDFVLRQTRFTDRGRPTPAQLSIEVVEGVTAQLTFARGHLASFRADPANILKWARATTSALFLGLLFPPKLRRGQFIIRLDRPATTWGLTYGKEDAAVVAGVLPHIRPGIPGKLTVKPKCPLREMAVSDMGGTLKSFEQRLSMGLSLAAGWYGHKWGFRGGRDHVLAECIGMAAAAVYHILRREMLARNRPSDDLAAIIFEANQLKGFQALRFGQDRVRGVTAYVITRACDGARGLKGLKTVAPFTRSEPNFEDVESFYATWVQPYTQKHKAFLPLLAQVLRPYLLGPRGALAHTLGLQPQSAL